MNTKNPGHNNDFEYRLFLHYTILPTADSQYFAYGNPPYFPIQHIPVDSNDQCESIEELSYDYIQFAVTAIQLLLGGHSKFNESIPIHDEFTTQEFTPNTAWSHGYKTKRYPVVKLLLSIATCVVQYPTSVLSTTFRKRHAALAITRPSSSLSTTSSSDYSMDLPIYPSPSSCEWEVVSTSSTESEEEENDMYQSLINMSHEDSLTIQSLHYRPTGFPVSNVRDKHKEKNGEGVGIISTSTEVTITNGKLSSLLSPISTIPFPTNLEYLLSDESEDDEDFEMKDLDDEEEPPEVQRRYTISLPTRASSTLPTHFDLFSSDTESSADSLPSLLPPLSPDLSVYSSNEVEMKNSDLKTCDKENVVDLEEEEGTGKDSLVKKMSIHPLVNSTNKTWESHIESKGWNISWDQPMQWYLNTHLDDQEIYKEYTGPRGTKPGILAYGPFHIITNFSPSITLDYWLYVHVTPEHDVLDHFVYGGPVYEDGKSVTLHRLSMSPIIINSSYNYVREYGTFVHQVEAYLQGDVRFSEGVPIPTELMVNPIRLPTTSEGTLFLRFPLVESFLGTLAARCSNERLGHPFGRLMLSDMHHIVLPKFPRQNSPHIPILQLHPPDLPYIKANFSLIERCHHLDTNSELPFPYYGCLC